tara:strand:+ start:4721 stop:4870 length:150 start_codon:yes stop_codon:yes gene_type:complete
LFDHAGVVFMFLQPRSKVVDVSRLVFLPIEKKLILSDTMNIGIYGQISV